MQKSTFQAFWTQWANEWYRSKIVVGKEEVPVASLCYMKPDYSDALYKYYNTIKDSIKEFYFKDPSKRMSRYKRAAVIAYAINSASPIGYMDDSIQYDLDNLFLKQRLAFYVAIGSVIQDYPEEKVSNLEPPIFDFESLGKQDIVDDEDDFLTSVYKDMFFADIYKNFNVLTMANLFGLLTERASRLGLLKPISKE